VAALDAALPGALDPAAIQRALAVAISDGRLG
jgi:hypothetical protein